MTDHDRPLNERGLSAAPMMGSRLAEKKVIPQLLISSSAVRALTTARFVAHEIGENPDSVIIEPRVYSAGYLDIMELVAEQNDKYSCMIIFGHNPTFTELINHWTDSEILNMPTASLGLIEFNTTHWAKTLEIKGKLLDFDYPKNVL
jgi:phosphohistidine phosphatase